MAAVPRPGPDPIPPASVPLTSVPPVSLASGAPLLGAGAGTDAPGGDRPVSPDRMTLEKGGACEPRERASGDGAGEDMKIPRNGRAARGEAELRVVLDLFEDHYESVFRFARRSVDEATAEDIAQEVFARLLRLDDLATRELRPAYLLKIAANLIKRRYQRERRFGEVARRSSGRHAESAATERSAPQVVGERAERGAAVRVLQSLSERERNAVDLIVCRGLSYREAAASMDAKVSDVNNWRYRGIERLRRNGSGGV
jgi:RNA polymerase sigma factor (sigma-70 family)